MNNAVKRSSCVEEPEHQLVCIAILRACFSCGRLVIRPVHRIYQMGVQLQPVGGRGGEGGWGKGEGVKSYRTMTTFFASMHN